ncbi:TVP38/TMEM64 family protein [Pantoea allii]|uniref:TVP38/TMEM64 family protein n=1 Tax=Pantoea allii TaxID=574096 RepID=UPI0024B75714|nr:VTT domain-containing protein [Pantoea allii]MDJ0042921.1 VTT domain-containing protein [Pantoea allii]
MSDFAFSVSHYLQSSGGAGAVLYFVIFVAATLMFFPASLLTAMAGWLFGAAGGTVLALLAGTTSALLAFCISKKQLLPAASRAAGRNRYLNNLLSLSQNNALPVILLLRLSSVLPFAPLNYVLGISGISFRKYATATVAGLIPGTYVYAAAGSVISDVQVLLDGDFSVRDVLQHAEVLTGLAAVTAGLMLLLVTKTIFKRLTGIPADVRHNKTGDR